MAGSSAPPPGPPRRGRRPTVTTPIDRPLSAQPASAASGTIDTRERPTGARRPRPSQSAVEPEYHLDFTSASDSRARSHDRKDRLETLLTEHSQRYGKELHHRKSGRQRSATTDDARDGSPVARGRHGMQGRDSGGQDENPLNQDQIWHAGEVYQEVERDEPVEGRVRPGFDTMAYDNRRMSRPYRNFVPSSCRRAPLRTFEQIPKQHQILSFNALRSAPRSTALIDVSDLNLTSVQRAHMCSHISSFNKLEILILRNVKLKTLDKLNLPNLRYADFGLNQIKSVKTVLSFLKRSPNIEHLMINGNPLCEPGKDSNWKAKVIATGYYLRSVNAELVSPSDHLAALRAYGSSEIKKKLNYVSWDIHVRNFKVFASMKHGWDPSALTELKLTDCPNVTAFHVGAFVNLRTLTLSNNHIKNILGSGLEGLDHLHTLDLGQNAISDKDNFPVFGEIPSLRTLVLEGNKVASQKKYRLQVLYYCRDLKGGNRRPGLVTLDGVAVTVDESMAMWEALGGLNQTERGRKRWEMTLIASYGQHHLHQPSFSQDLPCVVLSGAVLTFARLDDFRKLTALNLSSNALQRIEGLETLTHLRHLDLSLNPLDYPTLQRQLTSLCNLINVMVAGTSMPANFRQTFLGQVYHTHPYLRVINTELITVTERVDILMSSGADYDRTEEYRFALAVALQTAHGKLDPEGALLTADAAKGKLKVIETMSSAGLMSSSVYMAGFGQLTKLFLDHNHLATILTIGLQQCTKLRVLDVSNNEIHDGVDSIAELLDSLPKLEVFAWSHNPVSNEPRARHQLLASLTCMRNIDCHLRSLDTAITMDERVEAWKSTFCTPEQAEELRGKAILSWNIPHDVQPSELRVLDIRNQHLQFVHLGELTGLEILLLSDNLLTSVSGIGLSQLTELKRLDVSNNRLHDMEELAKEVSHLDHLEHLAIAGNPFVRHQHLAAGHMHTDDRILFLGLLPRITELTFPLEYLDDHHISVEDIMLAARATLQHIQGAELELYRFRLVVFRAVGGHVQPTAITELDLRASGLTALEFKTFSQLTKVSLYGNLLTEKDLVASGLDLCLRLTALDVRRCHIKDLGVFCDYISTLFSLEHLLCDNNPCMSSDSSDNRIKVLARIPRFHEMGFKLRLLNGHAISVDERVAAFSHSAHRESNEVDSFRLVTVLERKQLKGDARVVDLSHHKLPVITNAISSLSNCAILDLSHCEITHLTPDSLSQLPNLISLDLSHNRLPSLQAVVTCLTKCSTLTTLSLYQSTHDSSTSEPKSYVKPVCSSLRGLETLDGHRNPVPLTAQEKTAFQHLMKAARVGPNQAVHMDLSNQNLTANQFPGVVKALALIRPTTLIAKPNPWSSTPNYRFILIYHIPDLQSLDGAIVSHDERANSVRIVEGLKRSGRTWLSKVGVGTATGLYAAGSYMVDGGGAAQAEEEGTDMYEEFNRQAATGEDSGKLRALGSWVQKFEIVINFLQMFSLIMDFALPWPGIWMDLIQWTFSFNFHFEFFWNMDVPFQQYIKFGIVMAFPAFLLLLYKIGLNQEKWHVAYVTNWKRTRRHFIFGTLLYLLLTIILVVVSDIPSFRQSAQDKTVIISPRNLAALLICLIPGFLYVVWFLGASTIYRRRWRDPYFWYAFQKNKKRLALFFITITYLPIARTVLVTYKCNTSVSPEVLQNFPDSPCIESITDMLPIHWMALLFALLYIAGIPIAFFRLIRRGSLEINRLYGIQEELDGITNLKAMKVETSVDKIAHKKAVRDKRLLFKTHYATVVREYESAPSYLYQAYERPYRYFKLVQMFEKIILLAVSLYLITNLDQTAEGGSQILSAAGVLFVFTTTEIIIGPFSDGFEDRMDQISRLANCVNVAVGVFLYYDWLSADTLVWVLIVVNGLVIVVFLFVIIIGPVWNRYKARKLEHRKQRTEEVEARLRHKQEEARGEDDDHRGLPLHTRGYGHDDGTDDGELETMAYWDHLVGNVDVGGEWSDEEGDHPVRHSTDHGSHDTQREGRSDTGSHPYASGGSHRSDLSRATSEYHADYDPFPDEMFEDMNDSSGSEPAAVKGGTPPARPARRPPSPPPGSPAHRPQRRDSVSRRPQPGRELEGVEMTEVKWNAI